VYDHEPLPQNYSDDFNKIILSDKEKRVFDVYNAWFDLYERVWQQKTEKGNLDEDEWISWAIYLEEMSHHWIFRYTYNKTRPVFDSNFMDYIKNNIINVKDEGKDSREHLIALAKEEYRKTKEYHKTKKELALDYANLKIKEFEREKNLN
jgi:hypothetical protein